MSMIAERRCLVMMTASVALAAIALSVLRSHAYDGDEPANTRLLNALQKCVDASGREYLGAREEVLRWDRESLQAALAETAWSSGAWERSLVTSALRLRLQRPDQCANFDATIERWIETSRTSHVPNHPVSAPVGGFCTRALNETPELEAIVLERLFKYDDAVHVKIGIIDALGRVGTLHSVEALVSLMKSDEHPSYSGICAMGAAKISQRVGDTRVVGDIVTVYAKRVPVRGTGLPEEQLRRMPPWPHVEFILALRHLGGAEALKALNELRRTETDPVLVESLDNAKRSVQKRLDEKAKAPAP